MLLNILPLYLVIFISFFCYSSMLTVFVPLFQDAGSPLYDPTLASGTRNILSGVFLALYPLGQFLGSPVIGALSDRLGRKRILVASLSISCLSMAMIALAIQLRSVPMLGLCCFIAGLGESNMTIALSAIAGLTQGLDRVKHFSRAWVMCSLGYILGSMFGGVASIKGYVLPFAMESLAIALVILSSLICLREAPGNPALRTLKQEMLTFCTVFRPSPVRTLYLANFLFYLAFFGVLRVELIYMQDHLRLSPARIAFYYSYASVVAMAANFVVVPVLLRVLRLRTVLSAGVIGSAMSAVVFVLPHGERWLFGTAGLVGLFVPIVLSTSCSYLSAHSGDLEQGAVLGNNQSLQVLSEALSAAAGGLLFACGSRIPFFVFACVGLAGMAWLNRFPRNFPALSRTEREHLRDRPCP